jgi:hypothetical protein
MKHDVLKITSTFHRTLPDVTSSSSDDTPINDIRPKFDDRYHHTLDSIDIDKVDLPRYIKKHISVLLFPEKVRRNCGLQQIFIVYLSLAAVPRCIQQKQTLFAQHLHFIANLSCMSFLSQWFFSVFGFFFNFCNIKLMLMLMHAEKMAVKEGRGKAPIAWLPNGQSFVVVDKRKVAHELLPQFSFPRAKFESFVRKLYRWGFKQTISSNTQDMPTLNSTTAEVIVFTNKYFHRDRKGLLWNMESAIAPCRRRAKEKRQQTLLSPTIHSSIPKNDTVAVGITNLRISTQSDSIANGSLNACSNSTTPYLFPSPVHLSRSDQNHRHLQSLYLQEQMMSLRNFLSATSMRTCATHIGPVHCIERTDYMSYSLLSSGSNDFSVVNQF